MVVVLGLVTAFSWAFANLFTQQAARRAEPQVIVFWVLLVCCAALVPSSLLIDGTEGPWTLRALAPPVAAGLLGNVGFLLLLRALRSGSLSVVAPIIAIEGGVAAALSVALGERPSVLQVVLLGVAVVGTVLVSVEPGRRTAAGAGAAALASIAYAGALVGLGMAEQDPLTSVSIARTASLIAIVPLFLLARGLPPRGTIRPIVGCGLLDAVGFAFFAFAAMVGPLSVASVVATQWGTAAAVIGIVLLRERLHANQYVGIAVTLLAVTGLGIAGAG